MHTFTPNDNSLPERVRAYQRVHNDFNNINSSMGHINDKEWADRLGDKEDVEKAFEILQNSLHIAVGSIDQSELSQVKEQGLMSDKEVRGFIQAKRQQEMKAARASQQHSESHKQQR